MWPPALAAQGPWEPLMPQAPDPPSAAVFLSAFLPLLFVSHREFLDATAKGTPVEPPRGSWGEEAVSRSYLNSPWQPRLALARSLGSPRTHSIGFTWERVREASSQWPPS